MDEEEHPLQEAMDTVNEAITLHEKHMDDPKTATMASQKKLMQQLKVIRAVLSVMVD